MGKDLTGAFLLFWMLIAILWDFCIYQRYGPEATITYVVRDWARWCPFLALLLGALLWHLLGRGED